MEPIPPISRRTFTKPIASARKPVIAPLFSGASHARSEGAKQQEDAHFESATGAIQCFAVSYSTVSPAIRLP